MPGPDPHILIAYGPVPGIELIPYFLGLLAWMGLAVAAVLASPFTALLRRLRGRPTSPSVAESPGEGRT